MKVRIRPYSVRDAQALVRAALESVAEVNPWLPWCHTEFSEADATDWLSLQVAARESASAFEFCILNMAGDFLGGCGINRIDPQHRFGNLGYWVRSSYAGKGVATAAVRQLVDFARDETSIVRLEIVVAAGNSASTRVAEKVGAVFEGTLRNRLFLHGHAVDASMYAIAIAR